MTPQAPDEIFTDSRLAVLYDPLDPDRSDLDVYLAMAGEFRARSVLDIGCGTGTFALMLAASGREVWALDPAVASLDIARGKAGAERVTWIEGDATVLPELHVDLATMTANVAQVFLAEEDWAATLASAFSALVPGGRLIFESRDPAYRAWTEWTAQKSYIEADVAGIGRVSTWMDVTDVSDDLVSFRDVTRFESDGTELASDSTLRFRSREQLEASLVGAGFIVEDIRDAPDRPGREFVFIARRPEA